MLACGAIDESANNERHQRRRATTLCVSFRRPPITNAECNVVARDGCDVRQQQHQHRETRSPVAAIGLVVPTFYALKCIRHSTQHVCVHFYPRVSAQRDRLRWHLDAESIHLNQYAGQRA